MDEETKRWEEIEVRLEEERMLRQEQECRWQEERMQERQRMEQALLAEQHAAQQMQTMFSYLQGLGATINYQPPPTMPWPPPPLPPLGLPSIFPPSGATGTPVSMIYRFTLLAHTYSNFEILYVNISCAISERTSRLT